ncbi:MAG: UDP-N-acetylmuramate--L-alanine ligase, partial [Bacteroidales bacterium]
LLPIYPAREEPIPGVTSQLILDKATVGDKVLIEKDALMETLRNRTLDCLVTFGAGDIDRFIGPIENWLKTRE